VDQLEQSVLAPLAQDGVQARIRVVLNRDGGCGARRRPDPVHHSRHRRRVLGQEEERLGRVARERPAQALDRLYGRLLAADHDHRREVLVGVEAQRPVAEPEPARSVQGMVEHEPDLLGVRQAVEGARVRVQEHPLHDAFLGANEDAAAGVLHDGAADQGRHAVAQPPPPLGVLSLAAEERGLREAPIPDLNDMGVGPELDVDEVRPWRT
jgi:hypothetical protein